MSDFSPEERRDANIVLVISAVLGAFAGGVWMGEWQVAAESAQALAGSVVYPEDNSFYYYHLKVWTLLHQVLALFFLAGMSAKIISLLVSALLGAVTFGGLGLLTWLLGRNRWLAVFTPVLAVSLFENFNPYGVAYPIFMMGTHHTYGVLGRGLALLVPCLIAIGYRRSGLFLLGLLPAIHPTWGAWCLGVTSLALLWTNRKDLPELNRVGIWGALGVFAAGTSFFLQRYLARNLPSIEPEEASAYLDAFFTHWDYHRQPVDFWTPGVLLAIVATALLGVAHRADENGTPRSEFMVAFFTLSTLFGLLGCLVTWVPEAVPDIVNMIMPGRFLNLTVYAFPAILIGVMVRHAESRVEIATIFLATLGYALWNQLFLWLLSSDRWGWELSHWKAGVGAGVFAALVLLSRPKKLPGRDTIAAIRRPATVVLTGVILVTVFFSSISETVDSSGRGLLVRERDEALAAARAAEGMLISSGDMQLIQLRTGRPILMNTGGLDQITVAPGSGPHMERVLQEVYDIDLFNPPEDIRERRLGSLLPESGREAFERWSTVGWQAIRDNHDARHVLVAPHWELKLPLVAESETYRLYKIPKSDE